MEKINPYHNLYVTCHTRKNYYLLWFYNVEANCR